MSIFDSVQNIWDDIREPLGLGGGPGGPSGTDPYQAFLAWQIEQAAKQEEMTEWEEEQARAITTMRRGEIADRTGFSGLVNVGDATERSDATLAAEMAELASDDPTRIAYEDALEAEREQTRQLWRTITGERYEEEDAAVTETENQRRQQVHDDNVAAQEEADRVEREVNAGPGLTPDDPEYYGPGGPGDPFGGGGSGLTPDDPDYYLPGGPGYNSEPYDPTDDELLVGY